MQKAVRTQDMALCDLQFKARLSPLSGMWRPEACGTPGSAEAPGLG